MKQIFWLLSTLTLAACGSVDEPYPPGECPGSCPVIAICKLCDDGSCAEAVVSCNPDGSCGDVDWVCAAEPEPECPGSCAVPDICFICEDAGCAAPLVNCNEDGTCGEIEWSCE